MIARLSWGAYVDIEQEVAANTQNAILINAHFDSVPGSSGGSDDGVGVACMLEIARSLGFGPALKNPVIFLFNGAEESNHQVRVLNKIHVLFRQPLRMMMLGIFVQQMCVTVVTIIILLLRRQHMALLLNIDGRRV